MTGDYTVLIEHYGYQLYLKPPEALDDGYILWTFEKEPIQYTVWDYADCYKIYHAILRDYPAAKMARVVY